MHHDKEILEKSDGLFDRAGHHRMGSYCSHNGNNILGKGRVKYCEAFYLSSDLRYRIRFEFLFDIPNTSNRKGFKELTKAFTAHVKSFGRGDTFPEEIVNQLDDAGLDRLLKDTELIPELTYFIKLNSDEVYCSKDNCEPYRLRGTNAVMSIVETLDGKLIDILEMKNVMRVFERVKR